MCNNLWDFFIPLYFFQPMWFSMDWLEATPFRTRTCRRSWSPAIPGRTAASPFRWRRGGSSGTTLRTGSCINHLDVYSLKNCSSWSPLIFVFWLATLCRESILYRSRQDIKKLHLCTSCCSLDHCNHERRNFKDTNPLMSSLLVICLGWWSNFVGSESGQKQSVKLLQNVVYSTIQHPPPPQPHTLSAYTDPVFENVYGAQESIPRNRFRQPIYI